MSVGAPELVNITATTEGAAVVLEVTGEVCYLTAGTLRLALDGAIDTGARLIVLDLSRTRLLAAAGVSELVRAVRRIEQTHGRLVIRGASDLSQRVLRLCGLGGHLESHRTGTGET